MKPFAFSRIPLDTIKQYSLKEEIAHSIIHGLGALFGIVALTVLIVLASLYGTTSHMVSYIVYGSSLILLFLASTLYHALPHMKAKRIFKVADHAAIYLLIAGTYTPFLLLNLKGDWGLALMITVWGLALVGVTFKLFFTGRFKLFSTLTYIFMGWIVVIVAKPLSEALSPESFFWMAAGGLAYMLGTVFYLNKKLPYHHAIWHVFVLAGSICHFVAVVDSSNLPIG
jgi:hemolysin III